MSKLNEILEYASKHNHFYIDIIREYGITDANDLSQYPVLTRRQLQENRYQMFSDGYKSKYFSQQLHRQSSSGSSGMPVNVYWDYKNWYVSNMALWRKRFDWYGISPKDKCVKFTLSAINCEHDGDTVRFIKEPENILSINVSLIRNNAGWNKVAQLINEFNPCWLQVQPFILNKLVQIYRDTCLPVPSALKYIESIGELLLPDIRIKSEELFKIPVVNMYGSEEMNGIALECPYHHMHVLDGNVLVEVENDSGIVSTGEGVSIITNLNNYAMPLIRYNQGDRIAIDKDSVSCQCGCKSPIIKMISGRNAENIRINDQIEINPFMLSEIIMEVNNKFKDIINIYKYIYDQTQNSLSCYVDISAKDMAWFENVKKAILEVFKRKMLGNTSPSFRVFYMDEETLYVRKNKVLEIIGGS